MVFILSENREKLLAAIDMEAEAEQLAITPEAFKEACEYAFDTAPINLVGLVRNSFKHMTEDPFNALVDAIKTVARINLGMDKFLQRLAEKYSDDTNR